MLTKQQIGIVTHDANFISTLVLLTRTNLHSVFPRGSKFYYIYSSTKGKNWDACLCMGDLQAPAAPPFVFLITL